MKSKASGLGVMLAVLWLGSVAAAAYTPLDLDTTHSKVGFTAETLLFDVDGEFEDYTVEVDGDPNKPESARIRVTIDAGSIDTKNKKRDDHLRSPDFLDAKSHPKITFTSTSIRKRGNQLVMNGNLTIRGKTKPVSIPLSVVSGKNGAGKDVTTYKGKLTIDRNDFGVGADSVAAKISLEDEVELKLIVVTFR